MEQSGIGLAYAPVRAPVTYLATSLAVWNRVQTMLVEAGLPPHEVNLGIERIGAEQAVKQIAGWGMRA